MNNKLQQTENKFLKNEILRQKRDAENLFKTINNDQINDNHIKKFKNESIDYLNHNEEENKYEYNNVNANINVTNKIHNKEDNLINMDQNFQNSGFNLLEHSSKTDKITNNNKLERIEKNYDENEKMTNNNNKKWEKIELNDDVKDNKTHSKKFEKIDSIKENIEENQSSMISTHIISEKVTDGQFEEILIKNISDDSLEVNKIQDINSEIIIPNLNNDNLISLSQNAIGLDLYFIFHENNTIGKEIISHTKLLFTQIFKKKANYFSVFEDLVILLSFT